MVPSLKIEVVNVVATANTGHPIDLPRLAKQPNIIYDPSRYFCAYFKDGSMDAKVSVFTSGKLIAVGAKSEKSAQRDLRHTMEMLEGRIGIKSQDVEITIHNVVITVDIGKRIDLEALQIHIPGTIYEPEQFPGAVMRPRSHEVSLLAFASGKLVLAGLKSTSGMNKLVDKIIGELGLSGFDL